MADVWCAWEEHAFPANDFKEYTGNLLEHLGVAPRHTNDGREIGHHAGPGPATADGPGVSYGYGPMAESPVKDE